MATRDADSIEDLFNNAAQVLISAAARGQYEHWEDAINAPSVKPLPPTTHAEAVPPILLRGPFKEDPNLFAVAFYVGIGFIAAHAADATYCTYETSVIDGDGVGERGAFLTAARDLFFHDVKFKSEVSA
jgi:hypothetical protein